MGDARHDLLTRVVDDVATHGIADRSLREIAMSVGTSHRMLLYHFDSREGLVAAIVGAIEASQRSVFAASPASSDPVDIVRAVWDRVSDIEVRPFVQLFFEAVSTASRAGTGEFTSAWLTDAANVVATVGIQHDPVEIRLGIAVIRGLLIDVITGIDPAVATESLDRFLELWRTNRSTSAR